MNACICLVIDFLIMNVVLFKLRSLTLFNLLSCSFFRFQSLNLNSAKSVCIGLMVSCSCIFDKYFVLSFQKVVAFGLFFVLVFEVFNLIFESAVSFSVARRSTVTLWSI